MFTKQQKGYIMIGLAGSLWGTLGLFGKLLFRYDFTPQLTVFCRLFIAFWILFIIILFKDKNLLKIDKRGLKYTFLIGVFSQGVYNLLYFQSIEKTTIATAVVLLYTSPIFLIIMGRIFYKEMLNKEKYISLILCVIGCFLTVTGGSLKVLDVNLPGVLMGVGAGFNYALVTILSKAIIDEYNPITVIFYGFGFGWLFLMPFSNPSTLIHIKYSFSLITILLGFALIPSVFSYLLYIPGLSYGVEASKAGIISSLEIVVSVIISFMVFGENLWGFKLIGIILVLLSIVVINKQKVKVEVDIPCERPLTE